jgi:hypothetical protein
MEDRSSGRLSPRGSGSLRAIPRHHVPAASSRSTITRRSVARSAASSEPRRTSSSSARPNRARRRSRSCVPCARTSCSWTSRCPESAASPPQRRSRRSPRRRWSCWSRRHIPTTCGTRRGDVPPTRSSGSEISGRCSWSRSGAATTSFPWPSGRRNPGVAARLLVGQAEGTHRANCRARTLVTVLSRVGYSILGNAIVPIDSA